MSAAEPDDRSEVVAGASTATRPSQGPDGHDSGDFWQHVADASTRNHGRLAPGDPRLSGGDADAYERRVRHNAACLGITIPRALDHDHLMGMGMGDWPAGLKAFIANYPTGIRCGDALSVAVADWLKTGGQEDTP